MGTQKVFYDHERATFINKIYFIKSGLILSNKF